MEPIKQGAQGAAVEDIQMRLAALGYEISEGERDSQTFGPATATAVARFRIDHGLPLGSEVDATTWSTLVDEGYSMGDRTLYLRLPNFHGADVRQLQKCLNILGFSCGEPDGYYGVHTEAAVKQFQESQGQLADGMAFPDTFDAIDRLHHVWGGKPAAGPHPMGGMGFARAAERARAHADLHGRRGPHLAQRGRTHLEPRLGNQRQERPRPRGRPAQRA